MGIFIFFLIGMQHVITWPQCTFHSAILSLGHIEEELSTACRAAADALEILSNFAAWFYEKCYTADKQFNGSLCQSGEQRGASGERRGTSGERQSRSILDVASLEQFYASSACHSLPDSWLEPS